jgi:hypothetical protein
MRAGVHCPKPALLARALPIHHRTGADELMVTSQIFDHAARLRPFELTAEARDAIARA